MSVKIILSAIFPIPSDLGRQVTAGEVSITVRENVRSLHVSTFLLIYLLWIFFLVVVYYISIMK